MPFRPDLLPLQTVPEPLEPLDVILPSGLRLVIDEADGPPVVGISSAWDAGSRSAQTAGEAEIAARMLQMRDRGGLQAWEELDRLGCSVRQEATLDLATFDNVCPTAAFELALEHELGRLSDPLQGLDDDAFARAQRVVLLQQRRAAESPAGAAREAMLTAMLPADHAYLPVVTPASVEDVDFAGVKRFVEERYLPRRATLAISGDVDRAHVLRRIFETLPPQAIHPKLDSLTLEEVVLDGMTEAVPWPLGPDGEPIGVRKSDARTSWSKGEPPDPVSTDRVTVMAAVDRPHAIVAWALPGGFRSNDLAMRKLADLLDFYVFDELDRGLYSARCTVEPGLESSFLVCNLACNRGGSSDAAVGAMFRTLTRDWADTVGTEVMRTIRFDRLRATVSYHEDRADWSDVRKGRAATMARSAHLRGDWDGWGVDRAEVATFRGKGSRLLLEDYIKKGRAVVVQLEPMTDEERALSQSPLPPLASVGSARPAAEAASIAAASDTTWLDDLVVDTLDNGVRLIAGRTEAPIQATSLQFPLGDDPADRFRLNFYLDFQTEGYGRDWAGYQRIEEADGGLMFALSGPDGYFEQGLWRARDELESFRMFGELEGDRYVWAGFGPGRVASRWLAQTLSPGDPMTPDFDPLQINTLGKITPIQMNDYADMYLHPTNLTVVTFRQMKPEVTAERVAHYFEGWKGNQRKSVPPARAPAASPVAIETLGLFDDPTRASARVEVGCDLGAHDAGFYQTQALFEAASDRLFDGLPDSGLGLYAGGGVTRSANGQTRLILRADLRPEQVDEGISLLWGAMDRVALGAVSDGEASAAAFEVAASLPLRQQSPADRVAQLGWASNRSEDPLGFLRDAGEQLSRVDGARLAELSASCSTSRVTVVVGPAGNLREPLSNLDIAVEEVPWLDEAFRHAAKLDRAAYTQRKRQFDYKKPR